MTLLRKLLNEKGVQTVPRGIRMGGTMTRRLPSWAECGVGRSGSMNSIGTLLKCTTDFMTKYTKSDKDYATHFQQAFILGCSLIAAAINCFAEYLWRMQKRHSSWQSRRGYTLKKILLRSASFLTLQAIKPLNLATQTPGSPKRSVMLYIMARNSSIQELCK